jgi:hypothetical protein
MIFSARSGDVSTCFAALRSSVYSSSVRYRRRELSSLKNFTRQTGFEAARLRAMHQLKNAFKTARSLSTVECATVRKDCDGMVGAISDALSNLPRGRDSRAFLISLGGFATRFEPQLEVDLALPRRATGPVRGRGDATILETFTKKCHALTPANGGAIFRAVRIGLAEVESRCAGAPDCQAKLFVATDGEENIAIDAYIALEGSGKNTAVKRLVNDLPGLQTVFCGYVSTSEGGVARTNDALLDRWRSLFTHPENVQFQPYCGGRADKTGLSAAK